ncbi:MAG: NUDIX domain-containing protein [Leptolyngbya sp. SIO4C1]|nr:NUDIX domain-containing protein [Leptolyngbya sp. SIO4C1]
MTASSTLQVVAYAVVDGNRLLTVRKQNTAKFMFPGGKPEPGEDSFAAVVREVREELNCQVDLPTVQFLGEFITAAANEANTRLVAHVFCGQLLGEPIAASEIAEIRWLAAQPGSQQPDIDPALLAPLITDCVWPRLLALSHLQSAPAVLSQPSGSN